MRDKASLTEAASAVRFRYARAGVATAFETAYLTAAETESDAATITPSALI